MRDTFCVAQELSARLKSALRTCALEDVEALKVLTERHSQALEQYADADRDLRAANAAVVEQIGERVRRRREDK